MSIYTKFCFLFFWGCQSVRDRTAQAGAPIFKFTNIYMNHVFAYEHEVFDWIIFVFLGYQSVRDRTAQAGTPIFKCTSIYTKCTNMKCWFFLFQ